MLFAYYELSNKVTACFVCSLSSRFLAIMNFGVNGITQKFGKLYFNDFSCFIRNFSVLTHWIISHCMVCLVSVK